jgi:predicted aspartyl protease
MRGNFDNDLPWVEIEVKGLGDAKKLKAIVDTGNNSYLSLPYVEAFPLGLRLDGIEASTLADGNVSHHFVCRGLVTCDGKKVVSAIDINPQCPILIGNKLLKLLRKKLISDIVTGTIELVDSEGLAKPIEKP